jgi:hypothetical protein
MPTRDFIDAVTIDHGPTQFLARFFLDVHETALQYGLRITLESDIRTLLEVNERQLPNWYPLPTVFDHRYHDFDESNSVWIAARDRHGEVVGLVANRSYDWFSTDLQAELRAGRVHYARPERDAPSGEVWETTVDAAAEMRGKQVYAGALWFHPDHRGTGFPSVFAHLAFALAWTMWDADGCFSFIKSDAVRRGVVGPIGFTHYEPAVTRRHSPRGNLDMHLSWTPREEYREELEASYAQPAFISRMTETKVATFVPSRLRQGSSSRS